MDKCTWISPPIGTDATESLVLMSFGKAIITANSSFSWWAAVSGNRTKKVIAPIPWFKNLDEPKDLIPGNWLRIKSSWV
jgi:hypothetical protein